MLQAMFLMLIVVVPVYVLIIFIGRRYRAENTKAKYTPNWEHSRMEELVWWAIPFEIVLVLAALTWGARTSLRLKHARECRAALYGGGRGASLEVAVHLSQNKALQA
jgi:heme/copper-type cytochrome/quinol oxidase subunit 2